MGYTEAQTIKNDGTVTLKCRSRLSDLVVSFVDHAKINKGEPLTQAILRAIGPFGFTSIETDWNQVRNERSGIQTYNGAGEVLATELTVSDNKTQPNEGGYEFVKRLISRHGLLAKSGSSRSSLALVRPEYRQDPAYTLWRLPNGGPNTIQSGTVVRDWTDVPSVTVAYGRSHGGGEHTVRLGKQYDSFGPSSVTALKDNQEIRRIVTGDGISNTYYFGRIKPTDPIAPDNQGQIYRPFIYSDKESRNQAELESKLRREVAARFKDTLMCRYDVVGHQNQESGAVYTPDTMVEIKDGVAVVFETLWVESVQHSYSSNGGPKTMLTCFRKESFAL